MGGQEEKLEFFCSIIPLIVMNGRKNILNELKLTATRDSERLSFCAIISRMNTSISEIQKKN